MEEFYIADEIKSSDKTLRLTDLLTSFQLNHKPTDKAFCPLCRMDLRREHVYFEDEKIIVVETQNKKGHKNRIMVLTKEHGVHHNREILEGAIQEFVAIGKQTFDEDFILLSDRHSSINYHWHIVACDLDPEADDSNQIMKTLYVLIKNKLQTITAR